MLETAQLGWRARVHDSDAARFTVAGKMGRPASVHGPVGDASDRSGPSSPMPERKKKPLARVRIADSATDSSTETPPTVDNSKPSFARSTSEPNGDAKAPVGFSRDSILE